MLKLVKASNLIHITILTLSITRLIELVNMKPNIAD